MNFKENIKKDFKKAINNLNSPNPDFPTIVNSIHKAIEIGEKEALYFMGRLYRDGTGVEQDYTKTMDYWLRATELGSSNAMAGVGLLYQEGEGVEQNYGEAANWYKKSADAGNGYGMCFLGLLYHEL